MRQFYQIGVEALGSDHPAIDAETLEMLMAFLAEIGLQRLQLVLNSVGCPECRPRYRETLVRFLKPLLQKLCDDCQRRLETNPLRCFDCKIPADRELMGRAPAILENLCQTCRDHFDLVRSYLESFGVEYAIDPRLVRGLDYYRRTAFEVLAPELGAQNAVLGGGRYDGLSEEIGGPPVPGFGFAVGEDRLVMMLQGNAPHQRQAPDLFIAALSEAGVARALPLARTVRRARKRVLLEPLPHKSLKSQMRRANDVGARFVLMIGDQELDSGELTLKRMADGAQERVRDGGRGGCQPPHYPYYRRQSKRRS